MIVPRYYENLQMLHDNTMPPRAYYVPASKRMNDLVEHRENSDRLQFLNGNWKFRYFRSIYDANEKFYEKEYDTDEFDETEVPGAWQMHGYDTHQYTNIRYPFPFDPPFVLLDIPCGEYVKTFEYKKDAAAPNVFLNFEGVDSCFYVWLNGSYIGYSQVTHSTSEFDITDKIIEGTNIIAVLVMKWCDGSYLEDQDKFRMSGIIRDVYLIKRPNNCIRDYRIKTRLNEDFTEAEIDLEAEFSGKAPVKVTLEDASGTIVATSEISENGSINIKVPSPVLWNAEAPYLYTLILEADQEVIVDYVGFKKIEIKDKVLYFNGQNIKFRGVNRHDSDPMTGPVIDIEQLMKDLTMMKQHNFNAIRSSHYPNAPYFYQLCDKYGFMVIDEADIEAHGPFMTYYKEDTDYNRFKGWNKRIADDPIWEESILDRVQRMVIRDKNRPCIVMWSMGNESAYGCNFEKALKWTKEFDPQGITQYESARYRNYDLTYDYSNLDIYSRMYPAFSEVEEYLEKDASKPFLFVEYCHSMGNGPGDFEDYFQLTQRNDLICGGFVWEWCDHAIYEGTELNGKEKYLYGGDHGEKIHDGNFCMDGLVYPDRTPHTNLLEYKNVNRPARVVSFKQETGELVLHNYLDFDNLKDYVDISYEVNCDGLTVDSGSVQAVDAAPHQDGTTAISIKVPDKGKTYLRVIYKLKKDMSLIPLGHELGFDEVLLKNEDGRNQMAVELLQMENKNVRDIEVRISKGSIHISGRQFSYEYNKKTGMFDSLIYNSKEYLDRPMEINIWRAPTDNDINIKEEWKKAHYNSTYTRAYTSAIQQTEEGVVIKAHLGLVSESVQKIMDITLTWSIDGNGALTADMDVIKDPEFPDLPRFGIRMFLNRQIENVSYYGYGPYESYNDKHRASAHGLYRSLISDLHEDYIRPQENGSHFDCNYVQLTNCHIGLTAVAKDTFSFNASVYTQEELEAKSHNFELKECGSIVLCLDYAMNGIGSNSCGPVVMDQYRFKDTEFNFQFKLIPFIK